MSDFPNIQPDTTLFQRADFEKITQLVTAEFQIKESLLDQGTPTYYLVWPQETKKPFLRLLDKLKEMNLIAYLRKVEGQVILRITPKPPIKKSNPLINLAFLIATIATTFVVGYFVSSEAGIDPFLGGAVFSASILTVLGVHEMGHKITANKKKMEATSPYFIPGPPPLGTFGAVIMQKSLPANRDALFDVGSNGPIAGFIVALIFSAVGMTLLIPAYVPPGATNNIIPISWYLLLSGLSGLNLVPQPVPPNNGWLMHPIALAGWAGMIVTMLNLLPAGMLDGGHVAKSLVSDKYRLVLTILSVALLALTGAFIVMAILIVLMSFIKHPGPLDDVSSLSRSRKLLTVMLVAFFILSFPISL